MKRVWLAILILTIGTTVFCALRSATAKVKQESISQAASHQALTNQLTRLHLDKQQILERVSETSQVLAAQPPVTALTRLAERILSGTALENLSAAESEQLLAELDFNWNTTGDYLIVSKKSLEGISFAGVKDARLTDAVRATLAIRPQEQTALSELMQRLAETHTAWAKAHVEREAPSGDVLAKYTLPVNLELSQSLSNQFTGGIYTALRNERGQLFQQHAYSWMEALGMRSGPTSAYANSPTTMTVERYNQQSDQLRYTLQCANSQMQTSVSPWQTFPEAFRAIFPGGWQELAQHEGFELPKEFKTRAETR